MTQLGSYLSDSGRADQAARLLEPLAQDPEADADTLNALGIVYAQSGRAEQAGRVFERVLGQTPDSGIPLEPRRPCAAAGRSARGAPPLRARDSGRSAFELNVSVTDSPAHA